MRQLHLSFICVLAILLNIFFVVSVKAQQESQELLTAEELREILVQNKIPLNENADKDILGVNNVVTITVLDHPEISGEYGIYPNGKMKYDFVGELLVDGMTVGEIENLITESLSDYIVEPNVRVEIVNHADRNKAIYVIGQVERPGKIFLKDESMTVREALVQAGIPLLTADLSESLLLTPLSKEKFQRKKIDVKTLLYEEKLEQNFQMVPGDILYIPEKKVDNLFKKAFQAPPNHQTPSQLLLLS